MYSVQIFDMNLKVSDLDLFGILDSNVHSVHFFNHLTLIKWGSGFRFVPNVHFWHELINAKRG